MKLVRKRRAVSFLSTCAVLIRSCWVFLTGKITLAGTHEERVYESQDSAWQFVKESIDPHLFPQFKNLWISLTINSVPSMRPNPLSQSIKIPSMWWKACPPSPQPYPHEMCTLASSQLRGYREMPGLCDPLSCLQKTISVLVFRDLFSKMPFAIEWKVSRKETSTATCISPKDEHFHLCRGWRFTSTVHLRSSFIGGASSKVLFTMVWP